LTAKPDIRWNVWGEDGAKITSVEMRVDGKPVEASYDLDDEAVVYAPDRDLSVGDHTTTCKIELNGRFRVEKSWTFTVLPTTMPALPPVSDLQRMVATTVNQLRREHGLPEMTDHHALHHVSQSHADYMRLNSTVSHVQDRTRPGYLAAGGGDRSMLFGFTKLTTEVVSRSSLTPPKATKQLFDAPYHRLYFLRPGKLSIGTGMAGPYYCLTFGGRGSEGVVVSPPDGATDVPVLWDGNEQPNPLRMTGFQTPVGYPVTLQAYRTDGRRIALVSAKMFDEKGTEVKTFVNHPGNDSELKDALIIIPARPLMPSQRYSVSAAVTLPDGSRIDRNWSFKTAP